MINRYQPYPQMISSPEIIIEDYPAHWTLTKVKFNSIVKARVGWHGLTSDDFTDVGPFLVTGSDFKGKFIQWEQCYHCDEERYAQDLNIQLKNGDLLITKDGTIGKIALVSGLEGKATLNSGVFVVRPIHQKYTTQYYYWLLLSRAFTDFVDYYKTGSTIIHLYQDTFVNFKYPLPSLEEQQKIASFLDHETVKIDTLITKQEKLIELLTEKRQAVISHVVTKGLNPNVSMKDSGVEWLGEVPEHWVVKQLKYFFMLQRGHDLASTQFKQGGYPVYGSNGVIGYHSEYTTKGPCITVGRSGSVGEVNYVKSDFWAHNTSLFLKSFKNGDIRYIYYYLLSMDLKSLAAGSAVGSLDRNNIHSRHMAVPSLQEQQSMAKYLKEKLETFNLLTEKANETVKLLKERKTALISAAVTGKIDVRDWQPKGIQE
ncbi:type I restriction enzyme S subunit [Providencia alcalifaciens]|nr:type I restriction enzyme S subunit [Providencia alcalifaciens]